MKLTFSNSTNYELSDFHFEGLANKQYVIFDLEGTGPDAAQDSVTQIGAICLSNGETGDAVFESLVKPWKQIPPKIEALTGITNTKVAEAAEFSSVYEQFTEFCGESVLVTQCGYEYDFPLLDQECERAGLGRLTNERLDTKAIFALLHPQRTETFSTNFLSSYYRINCSEFKRHDALGDARLVARIFRAELEEAKSMGIDAFETAGMMIKRFLPPPL